MRKIALIALACVALGAQAASNVGTLDNVVGTVSVGGQGVVAQAKNGTPLVEGSTVLVSSKGKANVVLTNGCAIALLGSQHFTVNSKLSCEQSIASVKSLMATSQLAQAPLGAGVSNVDSRSGGAGAGVGGTGSGRSAVLAGFTGALGLGIIANERNLNKASGS